MGTLIQIDSTGHSRAGLRVQSADTAFGPSGQVLDVVSPDGTLTQIDASGPHVLLTGVQSADTIFGPTGEVAEVVNTTGTLTQFDSTGSQWIRIDSPMLADGFHPAEHDASGSWRWTSGDAKLLLPQSDTSRSLTLFVRDVMRGWIAPELHGNALMAKA